MRLLKTNLLIALATIFLLALPLVSSAQLIITGVFDGTLSGGTPKGVEVYVMDDIADLSMYGIGSANNGGGSDGEEYTFPAESATAGSFLYVTGNETEFMAFFGFAPTHIVDGFALSINGDDAVELFHNGVVEDVFGDINTDGTGEPWEYQDGWAYRVSNTGPDGSTFDLANWTFSGVNGLEGGTDNASATTPMPLGSYTNDTVSAEAISFDSIKSLYR